MSKESLLEKRIVLYFLFVFLFSTSIVSISLSTLFQVFIILFFFVDFLILNYFKSKERKNIELISYHSSNSENLILFKSIEFGFIFSFLLFFILSFIFSYNYKLSFLRLPIYFIIFLIMCASFYIFSLYYKVFLNLNFKIYLFSNLIILLFYIINILYLFSLYKNLSGIFSDRRSGLLRNAVGYAYCTIIPLFFIVFNFFCFVKNINKNNIKKIKKIFYLFISIIIFIFSVILASISFLSSGTRSVLIAFFLSVFIFLILSLFFLSRSIFLKTFSILVIIIFLISIFIIIEPIFEGKLNKNIVKVVTISRKFLLDKFIKDYWIFRRVINAGYEIKQISSWLFHPEITSRKDLIYFESAERAALISVSLEVIKKRFLTGTGPFAWNYYVNNNKDLNRYFHNNFTRHSHCHNDFLQIFSEFGFFSFLVFLFIVLLSFYKLIRNIIKEKEDRFYYILFFSLLVFFIIGGLTDYIFGHPLVGPFYSLLIGLFMKKNKEILNYEYNVS
ncbi:MAG: O-antigen ligase family protein [Spirochaetes bacterium]|nr:O-antigen ligase family protein [Spirochaetota bacterium]